MSLFARLSDGRERWSYSRREPAKQTVRQVIQTRTPATTAIDSNTIPHGSPLVSAKTPYVASSPTTIATAINRTGNESDVRWRNRHANATQPMLEMVAKMAAATAMTIIRPGGAIERIQQLSLISEAFRFNPHLKTVIDRPFVTTESLTFAIAQGVRPIPVSLGKRHFKCHCSELPIPRLVLGIWCDSNRHSLCRQLLQRDPEWRTHRGPLRRTRG